MQLVPSVAPSTRERLLAAAASIFARDGLNGATTRAIAEAAGVNEVTLFRHFQTKDKLLAAVVGQQFGARLPDEQTAPTPPTADLRADLAELARRYEKLLSDNLPLVRTMLGEIHHHHRDQEKLVFTGIFGPLKEAILARLDLAQRAGRLRRDTPAEMLADLFGGMIFTGVLRRSSSQTKPRYSAALHLESAVDLVLRGGSPQEGPA